MSGLRLERGWLKAAYAIAVVQTLAMSVLVLLSLTGTIPKETSSHYRFIEYAFVYPIYIGHYANIVCVVVYLCRTDWSDGIWRSWLLILGALAAGFLYVAGGLLVFAIRGFGSFGD